MSIKKENREINFGIENLENKEKKSVNKAEVLQIKEKKETSEAGELAKKYASQTVVKDLADNKVVSKNKKDENYLKDAELKEIESIMEEDLSEIYLGLSTKKKIEFKVVGEEMARQIRNILNSVKVQWKKIYQCLFRWFSVLSGVNRFFLEKEAKIKADKLIKLADKNK